MDKNEVIDILLKVKICLKNNSIENALEYIQLEIDNLKGITEKRCKNAKYCFYDNYCQFCSNLNCNSNKNNERRKK